MKLLQLSYLINYVLVDRIRYEIHKVAELPPARLLIVKLYLLSWRTGVNINASAAQHCMLE